MTPRPAYRPPPIDWASMPTHPEAAKLPMMGEDELKELAADIEAHGLKQPIVLWRDNRNAATGARGVFPLWLLDGRNRLAALKLLGIDNPEHAPRGGGTVDTVRTVSAVRQDLDEVPGRKSRLVWKPDVDPASFVVSLNIHRRHLSAEQKRQAVADHIKLDPTASDRTIGKKVGVDHKTAAKVRDDLEGRGEIPHVEKRTDSVGRKQPARSKQRRPPIHDQVLARVSDLARVTAAIERLSEDERFTGSSTVAARRGDLIVARDSLQRVIDKLDPPPVIEGGYGSKSVGNPANFSARNLLPLAL